MLYYMEYMIWNTLYLKAPKSKNEWKKIENNFEKRWNFHNCLSAIDGKHTGSSTCWIDVL